jgi:multiple RNA-binding domain-containing protein 1
LLLKNLPSGTNANTIRGLLAPYGLLKHLLIPPSGLVAIVQFEDPQSAASAAKNVAYCKIGNSIVYVERASSQFVISEGFADVLKQEPGFSERETNAEVNNQCLFVQNFPRGTDAKALQDLFVSRTGFRSLKLVRNDSKGEYAFVTFNGAEPASKAYEEMDGQLFAGRRLNIARSTDRHSAKPAYDSLESESKGSATCKLIVKNLPFEASLADLRTILRSVTGAT